MQFALFASRRCVGGLSFGFLLNRLLLHDLYYWFLLWDHLYYAWLIFQNVFLVHQSFFKTIMFQLKQRKNTFSIFFPPKKQHNRIVCVHWLRSLKHYYCSHYSRIMTKVPFIALLSVALSLETTTTSWVNVATTSHSHGSQKWKLFVLLRLLSTTEVTSKAA